MERLGFPCDHNRVYKVTCTAQLKDNITEKRSLASRRCVNNNSARLSIYSNTSRSTSFTADRQSDDVFFPSEEHYYSGRRHSIQPSNYGSTQALYSEDRSANMCNSNRIAYKEPTRNDFNTYNLGNSFQQQRRSSLLGYNLPAFSSEDMYITPISPCEINIINADGLPPLTESRRNSLQRGSLVDLSYFQTNGDSAGLVAVADKNARERANVSPVTNKEIWERRNGVTTMAGNYAGARTSVSSMANKDLRERRSSVATMAGNYTRERTSVSMANKEIRERRSSAGTMAGNYTRKITSVRKDPDVDQILWEMELYCFRNPDSCKYEQKNLINK